MALADSLEQGQFMTFEVAEEQFGIDVMRVQELIRYQKPSRIPNAPDVVSGVINFRGHIIPVIDMRRKFNFEPGKYDEYSVIIVLEVEDKIMGVVSRSCARTSFPSSKRMSRGRWTSSGNSIPSTCGGWEGGRAASVLGRSR